LPVEQWVFPFCRQWIDLALIRIGLAFAKMSVVGAAEITAVRICER
jgi:hypothetical protein